MNDHQYQSTESTNQDVGATTDLKQLVSSTRKPLRLASKQTGISGYRLYLQEKGASFKGTSVINDI